MRVGSLTAAVLAISVLSATACTRVQTRIHMNAGNKLYKAQKYEEAVQEYKKIIAIDSENWDANYQIAMSYLALYHPGSTHAKDLDFADKSAAAFERLLTLRAPDEETKEKVHNYYVALLRSAEKTDKVIAYYESRLKTDPHNPILISQLAEIYAKKGDFQSALKFYQKKTELDPKSKEAWYTVGVVCWERVRKLGPTLSDEERAQTIDIGQKAMEKALDIDPNYFDALVYMGLLYREQASALAAQMKNEEAGEAFNKAEEFRARAQEIGKKRMAEQAAQKGT